MKELEFIFREAFLYAYKNGTCNKVSVGSCFVSNDKSTYIFGCNHGEAFDCKSNGECFKYNITGIYESCEETRKYCASIHSEIDLINKAKELGLDNFKDGTVYVTRYPCINCAKKLVEFGVEKVRYCGRQEISDDVSELFKENEVSVEYFRDIDDYEYLDELDHPLGWVDMFYVKAYDLIKEEDKIPVVIQSYNDTRFDTLKRIRLRSMTEDSNWPVYLVVRGSQYDRYNELWGDCEYLNIISFEDELINNSGATRRQVQKYFYNELGYEKIITMDDDLDFLGYLVPTKEALSNNKDKSPCVSVKGNPCNIFAMFQIMSEKVMDSPGRKVAITCGMHYSFARFLNYYDYNRSARFSTGSMTQIVMLNLKLLSENDLYYRDTFDCGLDDVDFIIRIIKSKLEYVCFPVINYAFKDLGKGSYTIDGKGLNKAGSKDELLSQLELYLKKSPEGDYIEYKEENILFEDLKNYRRGGLKQILEFCELRYRFEKTTEYIKRDYPDIEWLDYKVKRNLPQIIIDQLRVREFQKSSGMYDNLSSFYIDIWEDGDLMNQYINRQYSKITESNCYHKNTL